jgi:hypothetical protein
MGIYEQWWLLSINYQLAHLFFSKIYQEPSC